MGRIVTFTARVAADRKTRALGIACDESTAILIGEDGIGKLVALVCPIFQPTNPTLIWPTAFPHLAWRPILGPSCPQTPILAHHLLSCLLPTSNFFYPSSRSFFCCACVLSSFIVPFVLSWLMMVFVARKRRSNWKKMLFLDRRQNSRRMSSKNSINLERTSNLSTWKRRFF